MMSRFSFAFDPAFVARNAYHGEPEGNPAPPLALFSWTMLSAVSLAASAAALIWFA